MTGTPPEPAAQKHPLVRVGAAELEHALATAELVVLDVDGTLIDRRVTHRGEEGLVTFHVHDGQGLVWLRSVGVHLAWISAFGSLALEQRAQELGVRELHLRVADKARTLTELQARLGVRREHTLVMGQDIALAKHAGLFVAPADARPEALDNAHLVTAASGGAGAVRELCERLLRARSARSEGDRPVQRPE